MHPSLPNQSKKENSSRVSTYTKRKSEIAKGMRLEAFMIFRKNIIPVDSISVKKLKIEFTKDIIFISQLEGEIKQRKQRAE